MKKYIKTKFEIYEWDTMSPIIRYNISGEIIDQADTIPELCDVIIYTDKYGNHEIIYGSLEQKKTRIEEIKKMGLRQGDALYGAIWVFDSNGAPALKPVAKMNEKGDWNCYEIQ